MRWFGVEDSHKTRDLEADSFLSAWANSLISRNLLISRPLVCNTLPSTAQLRRESMWARLFVCVEGVRVVFERLSIIDYYSNRGAIP
jgi:hypothetical protein